MLWVIFFVGALGASPDAMRPELAAGPFATLRECAAVGAIGIEGFEAQDPLRSFRASCRTMPDRVHIPGERLYDLQELTAIAAAENDNVRN
jgi:hypothetical protein